MSAAAKPPAITPEQIVAIRKAQVGRYGTCDPTKPYADSIAFGQAVADARDAQWSRPVIEKQPEALRLADALRDGTYLLSVERNATEAALRTQHALLERARVALGIRDTGEGLTQHQLCRSREILAAITQHLETK